MAFLTYRELFEDSLFPAATGATRDEKECEGKSYR